MRGKEKVVENTKVVEMRGTKHRRFREMKKSAMRLTIVVALILALLPVATPLGAAAAEGDNPCVSMVLNEQEAAALGLELKNVQEGGIGVYASYGYTPPSPVAGTWWGGDFSMTLTVSLCPRDDLVPWTEEDISLEGKVSGCERCRYPDCVYGPEPPYQYPCYSLPAIEYTYVDTKGYTNFGFVTRDRNAADIKGETEFVQGGVYVSIKMWKLTYTTGKVFQECKSKHDELVSAISAKIGAGVQAKTKTMNLTVSTDKKTYSPRETVIIRGSVWDAKGGLDGATVVVVVDGTKLTATTDSSGNYKKEVTLPSDISPGKHTVTVTASKTGYPDVSKTTSFNVGGEFKVSLETDKENYTVGDVIKINGVVTSPDPIGSDLELNLEIRIYDSSGSVYRIQKTFIHSDGSYNEQIKIFGENKPGPWGQEGEIGKWRIEAIAKKTGYPDAKADKNIVVQGCGDQLCQNDKGEYCYNCSIDCKCEHGEICDPFGEYTNPKTKCSPKVAYIVVSSDVSVYEFYWVLPRVNHMRKYYRSRNYQTISILMGDKDEVFEALSYPSTKAIAYFGHAGVPSIEGAPASSLGGTIYGILMKKYRALGLQKNEAINKANERANQPNLDYAYIHTCHSLDDTSLANYLLRSGGTYWGERGILTSTCPLEKYVKP